MPVKRKRKAQKKKKAKKDEEIVRDPKQEMLLHEMKLGILNTERYRRLWRETLTQIKLPDIGRNVEIAWQTVERTFDLKDYSISLLLDSLQELEDQRRRANGARVETFDRSLQIHEARLKGIDDIFHRNIEEALAAKNREFERIDHSRNAYENGLHKTVWRVNRRDENAANIAKSVAIGKIDTFTEDGQNERRIISGLLQKQLEDHWNDLRNIFTDYRKSTVDRRKAYEAIRRKDESDRQEIIRQWQRTAFLLDEIAKFRDNIHSYKVDATTELQEVIQQSDFFHATYRKKNKHFVLGREEDKRKATVMSREYDATLERFNKLINKAERMLTYLQICRRYETQDEKIIQTMSNYVIDEIQQTPLPQIKGFSLQMALEDYENTIKFWHRLGLAQLIATQLHVERDQLLTEARDLRKSIKHYLYLLKPTAM
ncbi:dynein regulatory complex subunit 2 [Osmia lignaria lignaria]|uniref:dynein regulatory complex subunit 2 n=1 Tax=Osmia lignaria lignaria TaxID=1437193 RepID=UPI00402B2B12